MAFRLFNLFQATPEANDGLAQTEREAIADLLHFALYADSHLALAEHEVINDFVTSIDWDPAVSFEAFEAQSIASARDAKENPVLREAFVESVRARLTSPEARALALKLTTRLFGSDGLRTEQELKLQELFKRVLG